MEITFTPHIGKKSVKGFGEVDVDLKQKFVFVIHPDTKKKLHIGFIGTHENAPFNPISRFGEELRSEVISAAKAAELRPSEKQVASPVAIPQTDESE